MKKILVLATIVCMGISIVGCGGNESTTGNVEGTLPEIMVKVTEGIFPYGEELQTAETEVTQETFTYNAKIDYIDGIEGLASDSMMGQAHSVLLLRIPEGVDPQEVADDLLAAHTDGSPSKWICVNAEAIEVAVKGDLVLLVQSFVDPAAKVLENFNDLA